ncbi:MAG: 4'-phosphopantetheinyl transferase superfamily protein [Planctomycetota bacterium]|nr:4'-phosphopantetheinyl transferase superfamily protein [Planctomycetota bacterium]
MKVLSQDFDTRLVVAAVPIFDASVILADAECAAVANATEKRKREYTTGRWLARELLHRIGSAQTTVACSPDRSPRWPRGFVGSIAHTDRRCVVAVGHAHDFASVGIDIEPVEPVETELFDFIATTAEREKIECLPVSSRGRAVRQLFTAKEAAYKCVYPLLGKFLDFAEIEIEFPSAANRFSVTIAHPAARELALVGSIVECDGCFYTLVTTPVLDAVSPN